VQQLYLLAFAVEVCCCFLFCCLVATVDLPSTAIAVFSVVVLKFTITFELEYVCSVSCFCYLCWCFYNLQWNLDLTKSPGTGQICSLNRGFVISKTSIHPEVPRFEMHGGFQYQLFSLLSRRAAFVCKKMTLSE